MRGIDLEAVFARVAGARHDDVANGLHGVERQLAARQSQHPLHDVFRLRALHGQLAVVVRTVLQVDVETLGMLLHPGPVLVDVGRVDDEEEVLLAHLVDQQVVDGASVFVAHHAIVYLSYRRLGDVVGEDVLHVALGILAANRHFAHVRHVEHACMFSHGLMLLGYAALIQKRHVETAKLYHRSIQQHVLVVKARMLHFLF